MNRPPLILVPTPFESELLFGPTDQVPIGRERHGRAFTLAWCGFGVAAAAALTMRWLERLRPGRALLVGIAGTLRPETLAVGAVLRPRGVRCHGIGAGEGEGFTTLPFPQVPEEITRPAIHEALPLAADAGVGELLTVTAAAKDPDDARRRRERHPEALAEDMEAFGVALSARLCGVPLTVLRGISNVAGERDKARWDVRGALAGLQEPIQEWLAEPTP